MSKYDYDLIIIGSGPSGRAAAIQAGKLKRKVLVVDRRDRLGGVSVHTGTIPSKTLRETVLNPSGWRERSFYGRSYRVKDQIRAEDLKARLHMTLDYEVDVLEHQFNRNHVETMDGVARFTGPHEIEVTADAGDTTRLTAAKFLISTGTKTYRPDYVPFNGKTIVDGDEFLEMAEIPRSLCVIGAGVIGVEYATMFSALNLGAVGIETDHRNRISVDRKTYQTSVPQLYATWDVIGHPSLASTSMQQGRVAACHALETPTLPESPWFPYGIYSVPEISTCGMSEEELQERGIPYEVGVARFRETSRGHIMGLEHGMLKMLFSLKTRRVLGVQIVGEGATELIHIAQAVLNLKGTVDYFVQNTFNYPTLAEAYKIAGLDAFNRMPIPDEFKVRKSDTPEPAKLAPKKAKQA